MKPSFPLAGLILGASLWVAGAKTSNGQSFKNGEKFHLGVVMGLNTTGLIGTELADPQYKTGMALGVQFRKKVSDQFQFGSELNFSLRGSNFDFAEENHYYAIKFTYMDLPIYGMLNTSASDENRFVVLGLEPAFLLQSEIYVNPDFRPAYRNEFFKRFDLAALAGYRFDFYYFGLQPGLKIGLINISDQMNMEGVSPKTGNGGTIKNLTFDLKFYF